MRLTLLTPLLFTAALIPASGASLTAEMWEQSRPIYTATLAHPYLTGLASGTLPKASFHFYLLEDTKYLRAFSEALNKLARKAPRPAWTAILRRHASEAIQAEGELHASILAAQQVAQTDSTALPAPSSYAYINHFSRAVEQYSFAEGLAALLPCYWIYWEVGKELIRRGSQDPDYQRWINQYASESYGGTVRQVLEMMDTQAPRLTPAQRRNAIAFFVTSARYEYMFWDMAWRLESWPPPLAGK